jgi:DNA repair ATPase RecN
MTKGIPWKVEEEIQLKKLIEAKTPMDVIASTLKRTPTAILLKCQRLGLVPTDQVTQSALPLPDELPSVEETLKELAAALKAAKEPGLNKVEVQRLQAIATIARTYKEILSDYLNYREVEAKLNDMEAKYAALLETKSQNNAPQPVPTQMAKTPEQ